MTELLKLLSVSIKYYFQGKTSTLLVNSWGPVNATDRRWVRKTKKTILIHKVEHKRVQREIRLSVVLRI